VAPRQKRPACTCNLTLSALPTHLLRHSHRLGDFFRTCHKGPPRLPHVPSLHSAQSRKWWTSCREPASRRTRESSAVIRGKDSRRARATYAPSYAVIRARCPAPTLQLPGSTSGQRTTAAGPDQSRPALPSLRVASAGRILPENVGAFDEEEIWHVELGWGIVCQMGEEAVGAVGKRLGQGRVWCLHSHLRRSPDSSVPVLPEERRAVRRAGIGRPERASLADVGQRRLCRLLRHIQAQPSNMITSALSERRCAAARR